MTNSIPAQTQQITMSVDAASHALSIGKTKLYELLSDGAIRSVTIGKKRLIVVASMHDYINELQSYGL